MFWQGDALAYLTIVAGVIGSMLLPIAYVTFFLMMNQESLMGDKMPRGAKRVVWNVLMAFAALAATAAGISAVIKKAGMPGLIFVGAFIALVLIVQAARARRAFPNAA